MEGLCDSITRGEGGEVRCEVRCGVTIELKPTIQPTVDIYCLVFSTTQQKTPLSSVCQRRLLGSISRIAGRNRTQRSGFGAWSQAIFWYRPSAHLSIQLAGVCKEGRLTASLPACSATATGLTVWLDGMDLVQRKTQTFCPLPQLDIEALGFTLPIGHSLAGCIASGKSMLILCCVCYG